MKNSSAVWQPNAMAFNTPGYFIFQPYSHTDRRQLLTLIAGPLDTKDRLAQMRADTDAKDAQECLITPIELTSLAKVVNLDKPRRDSILNGNKKSPDLCDFQFISASWNPAAPRRIRLDSRPLMMLTDAFQWSEFISSQAPKSNRIHIVLQLMDPENAIISPA